jgi:hypothetical protein
MNRNNLSELLCMIRNDDIEWYVDSGNPEPEPADKSNVESEIKSPAAAL